MTEIQQPQEKVLGAVQAEFFDGQQSIAQTLHLSVLQSAKGVMVSRGAPKNDRFALSKLQVSASADTHFVRLIWPDGSQCESHDAGFFQALTQAQLQVQNPLQNFANRLSRSWRGALLAFLLLVLFCFASYFWLIPKVADWAAAAMPDSAALKFEQSVLKDIDGRICKPSRLNAQQQQAIQKSFQQLLQSTTDTPSNKTQSAKSHSAQPLIRDCPSIGPNALNIGRTTIIMTDDFVRLSDQLLPDPNLAKNQDATALVNQRSQEALMGVLAHELGHLQEDHVMRGIIFNAGLGALVSAVLGDVSTIVTALPTMVLHSSYSRNFEKEADTSSISLLQKNGVSSQATADLFKAFAKKEEGVKDYAWLLTHPMSEERAARFEQAAAK